MLSKKTIDDLTRNDLDGKRVLVRVDYNVPLHDGVIMDDARIRGTMPTLRYLLDRGAMLIIISHLGRPEGVVDESLRLRPVSVRLSELLGKPVGYSSDCVGAEAEAKVKALKPGDVLLLENIRFHKEEIENESGFSKKLASFGDIFVQEAFGTSHRVHASTSGIAAYLPGYAGFLIKKELTVLAAAVASPKRPFVAIIGGAKVSSKFRVLETLLGVVDTLVIGGGMAFTFLKAQGKEIGKSLCEDDKIEEALSFLNKAKSSRTNVLLPVDQVVVSVFKEDALATVVDCDHISSHTMGVDIGPKTIEAISKVCKEAKTVLWNGPLGVFEMAPFSKGTFAVANVLAENDGITIVGGGDSAAAIAKAGLVDKMTHISTGGGASLEFLEGRDLPGISVLQNK